MAAVFLKQYVNAIILETTTAFSNVLSSFVGLITNETTRAEAAEATLSTNLTNLTSTVTTLETFVSNNTSAISTIESEIAAGLNATPGPFLISDQTISSSITIASTQNALSIGPVTIAPGVTVTLEPGSKSRVLPDVTTYDPYLV